MRCRDFRKHIADYVDHRLEPGWNREMETHACECDKCAEELRRELDVVEALMSVSNAYTPPYVLRDVLDSAESSNRHSWNRGYLKPIIGFVVLTVMVFTIVWLHPNRSKPGTIAEPTPDVIGRMPMVKTLPPTPKKNTASVTAKPRPAIHHRFAAEEQTTVVPQTSSLAKTDNPKPKVEPISQYMVVMTVPVDPGHTEYPQYVDQTTNQVDSYYSIQVTDPELATVTNVNVVNEITPNLQPKTNVDISITNTEQSDQQPNPDRSSNDENNYIMVDNTDDTGIG